MTSAQQNMLWPDQFLPTEPQGLDWVAVLVDCCLGQKPAQLDVQARHGVVAVLLLQAFHATCHWIFAVHSSPLAIELSCAVSVANH